MLCGFLAPDGTYTSCPTFAHTECAFDICEEIYGQEFLNGILAEDFLYEKGYVIFYARNARYRFFLINEDGTREVNLLTDNQIDFIINHLEQANNFEQRNDMLEVLEWNEDIKEDSVLTMKDNEKERWFLK